MQTTSRVVMVDTGGAFSAGRLLEMMIGRGGKEEVRLCDH